MDAKGVRNMYSILVVVNKHNTARLELVGLLYEYIYYIYIITYLVNFLVIQSVSCLVSFLVRNSVNRLGI